MGILPGLTRVISAVKQRGCLYKLRWLLFFGAIMSRKSRFCSSLSPACLVYVRRTVQAAARFNLFYRGK